MLIEEKMTEVAGWTVIYPASCNGHVRDLGFVFRTNGTRSDFVHFDSFGQPYGTFMPKKVKARLIAMRNRLADQSPHGILPFHR